MFVPLVPNDQYESMHQCFQFVQEMLWQPLDDQKPDKETLMFLEPKVPKVKFISGSLRHPDSPGTLQS